MNPESLFPRSTQFRSVMIACDADLLWGDGARQFASAASAELALRASSHFGCPAAVVNRLEAATLIASAKAAGVTQIITPFAPVGPVAEVLAQLVPVLARDGIKLVPVHRAWDSTFWPHAKKGFFAFKEHMPDLLREHGLV